MQLSPSTLAKLKEHYPYAVSFLDCFTPLEEHCHKMVKELPPPVLPEKEEINPNKALYPADEEDFLHMYLDAALLGTAQQLCLIAAAHVQKLHNDLQTLADFLPQNINDCKQLASLILIKKPHRIAAWAKKHAVQKDAAALIATYLAHCAALRIAHHAKPSETWDKNFCPVCAHIPNAGYLKEKEGNRYLHCSLCNKTWRYSRTVCPVCENAQPEKRLVYNLEGGTEQLRAEGCKVCQHYMLVPDLRDMGETVPLSLLLYCLMPMDMLMQEQGYQPITSR